MHQESESDLWQAMDKLVTDFGNSSGSIFVWSPKIMTPYQHLWGIEPTESYWQQLEQRLQKEGKIYTNGHIQIYEPR